MKKYKSPSGYYELNIPQNWNYSQKDNMASFYDELNGVGALQISSYLISKGNKINVVNELAIMLKDKIAKTQQDIQSEILITNGIAHYNFNSNNKYWEYYMLFKNNKLLFITYNCNENDIFIEKETISKIIQSILL